MGRVKKRAAVVRCVGCEERVEEAEKVEMLGYVCLLCMEVLPLVWETEIERVKEARRRVKLFIRELTNGLPMTTYSDDEEE